MQLNVFLIFVVVAAPDADHVVADAVVGVLNSQQLGGRAQHNNKSRKRTTYAMTGTMPMETKTKTKTTTRTEMTAMKITRRMTTIGDVTCSHRHSHKHSSSYQQQQQQLYNNHGAASGCVYSFPPSNCTSMRYCDCCACTETYIHTYRFGVVCGSIINKITSTCALVCSMFGVHCLQQTQSILKQRDKIWHSYTHTYIYVHIYVLSSDGGGAAAHLFAHIFYVPRSFAMLLLFDIAPFLCDFGRKLLRCTLLLATAIGIAVKCMHIYTFE